MRQVCANNKRALAQLSRTNCCSCRDSCFSNAPFSKVEYNTHKNPYSLYVISCMLHNRCLLCALIPTHCTTILIGRGETHRPYSVILSVSEGFRTMGNEILR